MAVGDLVNVFGANSGGYLYYQPASGVETIILSVATQNDSNIFRLDGTTSTSAMAWSNLSQSGGAGSAGANNMKFGATNSVYIGVYASSKTHNSFTGIQTK